MSKVITFSRHFQKGHPREGQLTFFVEQIINSFNPYDWDELPINNEIFSSLSQSVRKIKHHTIRRGNRFKVGDKFSPRVWSGKPYRSKQIQFLPDLTVKQIYPFELTKDGDFKVNGYALTLDELNYLAKNDGLSSDDFECWFNSKEFKGQVICWSDAVRY